MSVIKDIAQHYVEKIITSPYYFSKNPVKDTSPLFPDFLDLVNQSIEQFNETYPNNEVLFVETYRSNTLQLIHFNNGASKIRKNGMHHYGIAVDCAFKINGKFSYNGDYKLLRKLFSDNGLNLLGLWDMGHVQHIPVSDQNALRSAVDEAVRNFQEENDLTADGIVGPKTINKAKEIYLI